MYLLGMAAGGGAHGPVTTTERQLWHRRLRHPSIRVIDSPSSSPRLALGRDSLSTDAPCEVCLHAKQTRDVFPLSDNKAASLFFLIHCDFWEPY